MRKIAFILFLNIISIVCAEAQDYKLGKINFQAVGHEVAQPYFIKGMLLLHNFEYAEAAQEFDMAQLLDADFVMAYWGEAMCYNQPIWFQQDYEKGKGALYKLGVKAEERAGKAKNEIEKGFIQTIELLYGDEGDYRARNEVYENAMAEFYAAHKDNEEVAAFYALSILGNCYTGDEEEKYKTAANILMKLQARNPEHPGALNYLVHLYDNPTEAYKGKKAADQYSALVRDSRYALHAPSHVYLASGEWDQVVNTNEAAWKSTEAWVKKKQKSLEDRDYHSLWWLQYGYLQSGKFSEALKLITDMNHDIRYSQSERMRFHLAMMRGHYLAESGNWLSDVVTIEIPTRGFNVSTKNMCFFVDGMAAIARNDFPRVDWYLNQMMDQRAVEKSQQSQFNDFRICGTTRRVRTTGFEQELALAEAMEWELRALKALKMNKLEEAAAHIVKAVDLEDETRYEPGPPVVLLPTHEVYGEILTAQGKYEEAIKQFDLALQRAPNRSRSLLGKYNAHKKQGQNDKAAQIKNMLMINWKAADGQALRMIE